MNADSINTTRHISLSKNVSTTFDEFFKHVKVTVKGKTRRKSEIVARSSPMQFGLSSTIPRRAPLSITEADSFSTITYPFKKRGELSPKDKSDVGHVRRLGELIQETSSMNHDMLDVPYNVSPSPTECSDDRGSAFTEKRRKSFSFEKVPLSPTYLNNIGFKFDELSPDDRDILQEREERGKMPYRFGEVGDDEDNSHNAHLRGSSVSLLV